MKLSSVILVVCAVARRAEPQTRQGSVPGRIYFTDINGNLQALDPITTQKTEVDVQKSVEVTSQVDQNYLQTLPSNGYSTVGQNLNENVAAFRPSRGQLQTQTQPQRAPESQFKNEQVQAVKPQIIPNTANLQAAGSLQEESQASGQNVIPLPKPTVASSFVNAPVSRAVSNFGINLLRTVRSPSNVVVSPFSIVTLLAVLQQGALGETQQQISNALQMTPDYAAGVFKTFYDDILKRNSRNILRIANNVFVADAFDLNKSFKQVVSQQFASEVTPFKFYQSDAADKINKWVASKTNNKIDKLLAPSAVGQNTQVVLVNAVYFKGLWKHKFRTEATQPRDFRHSDGSVRPAPFMHMRRVFKTDFDADLGAQVLILPFENDQYSLMVVLPDPASTVDVLLSTLTEERLIQYHTMKPKDVSIHLPKFTARADIDLSNVFTQMGISKIFSEQAELSGLGMYRTNSPQVTAAVHSAMLSIDEEGGTAAAATAVSAVALSYDHDTLQFNANRPFLAVLWDNQAIMPLFMAKIENPAA